MKLLVLIFLGLPFFAIAQRDSVAMKDANKIIIITGKTASENYKLVLSALSDLGDVIRVPKDDSLTVRTQELQGRSAAVRYQIMASSKENEIVLSGTYNAKVDASLSGTEYKVFVNEISNSGKKSSAGRYLFEIMQDVARKFDGQIFYTKDKVKKKSIF